MIASGMRVAAGSTSQRDTAEQHPEQHERERAGSQAEHGAQREPAPAARLERPQRESANAIASANGNAADSTMPGPETANVRLDSRASGPHWRSATSVNASAAAAIVATASTLMPSSAASG